MKSVAVKEVFVMRREDELVIRINSEGKIFVEDIEDGVKSLKR